MPRPMHRSRSKRRLKIRTPGGQEVTHYLKRRPHKPRCNSCGTVLFGVTRKRATGLARESKTKKRPGRPYAGQICHRCIATRLKTAIRGL